MLMPSAAVFEAASGASFLCWTLFLLFSVQLGSNRPVYTYLYICLFLCWQECRWPPYSCPAVFAGPADVSLTG